MEDLWEADLLRGGSLNSSFHMSEVKGISILFPSGGPLLASHPRIGGISLGPSLSKSTWSLEGGHVCCSRTGGACGGGLGRRVLLPKLDP